MYRYYNYYTSVKDFKANWENYSSSEIRDMCRRQKLSKKTLREMQEHLDWDTISQYQPLTEELMFEFKDKINWSQLIRWNKKIQLTEQFVEKMADYIDWTALSRSRFLSEEFVQKHADVLDADALFGNYKNRNIHTINVLDHFLKNGWRDKYKWLNNIYEGVTFEFVREYKDIIKFCRIMNCFSNKIEKFVDEFGQYFTREDWDTAERFLYNASFDFIVKYSEHWRYTTYSNPLGYHNNNNFTEEQKDFINNLWNAGTQIRLNA